MAVGTGREHWRSRAEQGEAGSGLGCRALPGQRRASGVAPALAGLKASAATSWLEQGLGRASGFDPWSKCQFACYDDCLIFGDFRLAPERSKSHADAPGEVRCVLL
jgi:hypothetical protein